MERTLEQAEKELLAARKIEGAKNARIRALEILLKNGFSIDGVSMQIKTPGKYEAEMYYVPYFHVCALEGGADDVDREERDVFELNEWDKLSFPELEPYKQLKLEYSQDGFVIAHTIA